eukprot:3593619-Pyramimonas_sp.AAC.1
MAIQSHLQLRSLRAFSNLFFSSSSNGGILAGCSLAASSVAGAVVPRPNVGPADLSMCEAPRIGDVSFHWSGLRFGKGDV